ncbi:uncharacterized protein LOC143053398 isoform X3 [Mytilus galloprovincialis]|uniref:uncharacterized protein LOC143053398 isoform X3 n=1 Tax=Mytilus galloprovincialis TaxID=29158 RepID=UPI003F7B7BC6
MESYPNPEDLEYEPKISESTNYLKFLKLTHDGHHSEDEGHYDSEGYYEDDIVGDIVRTESDQNFLYSDLPEVDEHLYDSSLNSPSYETVDTGSEPPIPVIVETPEERAERLKLLQDELEKVEEEIVTLRQVLGAKVRRAAEIKRQMGITPFQEFKQDLQHGFKSIQDSDAMQKTNERLTHIKERITSTSAYQKTSSAVKTASEKTSAAFSTVGSTVSRKLSDVRNSTAFKSMEEKVGGAVANVKAKVGGSKSENNFEDALIEETKGANSESAESKPADEKIPL